MVSAYVFMSPVSSSMMAPTSHRIAAQFGVTNETVVALLTSMFLAPGPLILGPMSEVFGRQRVLQLANFWYLVWNFACAWARNERELLAFRFLSGFGGNGLLAIAGGVLGDVWRPEQRGQAVAVYTLAPLLGPVVGPICGAWIAEKGDWRWVFWAPTSVAVAVQLVGLLVLEETYPPVLLARKAKRFRKELADSERGDRHPRVRTVFDGADRKWNSIVQKALIRPFMLFFREPIIQLLGSYMAFIYGTLYLFLTTIPLIFQGIYQESLGIAGLNYIALGIGLSGVSQISARLLDVVYTRLTKKNGGVGKPEYRLLFMFPGTILLPAGLLITGWTARASVHWIVPDIGIVLVGAGMILNFQSIQIYIIDAFTLHAASATPILFWLYGERIRKASRYAKHA
ncbi:MFS general substrate transporter [Dichomitus squalens]|uniref:MFS general substrate transporter n=1 Tax=Dichomitus squalens TaxID=114155 RepID=A0A4Q9N101_9APHY|nr:MFS general substrate transporter [Dichomitus squalens]